MSFRARLLLCVLLLSTLVLDACLVLMVRQSAQRSLDRERARALGGHYQLCQLATDRLNQLPRDADRMNALPLVHSLLARGQGVEALYWYVDGAQALAQPPMDVPPQLLAADGLRRTVVADEWLLAAARLPAPYDDVTLVTATSLAPLIQMNRDLAGQMAALALAATLILALAAFGMLKGLLAPVDRLSAAMARAMEGDFSPRVDARGQDELAILAQGFNRMAATTQRHMDQLAQSAQASLRFSDNLAHEMRTPVTAIGGYARSLLQQPLSQSDRQMALRYIAGESLRLQKMSEALLTLSGVREGTISIAPVALGRVFDQVAKATALELQEKGLRLVVRREIGALNCDEALIHALLVNLIVNSARASAPGQVILLIAGIRDGAPLLQVIDQGQGMTEQQIRLATQPFYRTDVARARKEGGAGLGLALATQIATAHGAALTIQSSPGQGTTVSVAFTSAIQLGEDPETPIAYNEGGKGMTS